MTPARRERSERRIVATSWSVPFIAALAILGILTWHFRVYTMDDAFITFRYATNFANGKGLVFNPGDATRAEGLTSPLYGVLLSVAPALGVDIESFAKGLGVAATVATAGCIGALVRGILLCLPRASARLRATCAGAAVLGYLSDPFVAGNAVSGMETACGAASFMLFAWTLWKVLFESGAASRSRVTMLGSAAILVPLFRPEMALAVLSMLAASYVLRQRQRRSILLASALFGVLGVTYFAARWAYYGLPLPLPFYVKQGGFGFQGLPDVKHFMRRTAAFGPTLVAACVLLARPLRRERPEGAFVGATVLMLAVQLFYYATIRQIMGFGFRYFQSILPMIALLAFVGIGCIWTRLGQGWPGHAPARVLVIACLGVLPFIGNVWGFHDAEALYVEWYSSITRGADHFGRALANAAEGAPLSLAINDCGIIPFRTEWPVIDLGGLNDIGIALSPNRDGALRELSRARPDLIVLVARARHNLSKLNGWEHLSSKDILDRGYSYKGDARIADDYHMLLFARRDAGLDGFITRLIANGGLEPRRRF